MSDGATSTKKTSHLRPWLRPPHTASHDLFELLSTRLSKAPGENSTEAKSMNFAGGDLFPPHPVSDSVLGRSCHL